MVSYLNSGDLSRMHANGWSLLKVPKNQITKVNRVTVWVYHSETENNLPHNRILRGVLHRVSVDLHILPKLFV